MSATEEPWERGRGRPVPALPRFLAGLGDRSPSYLAGVVVMAATTGLALLAFLGMVRMIADPAIVPAVDLWVMDLIEPVVGPRRTRVMIWVTWLGSVQGMTVMTIALGAALWLRGVWRDIVELLIAVLGGAGSQFALKALFQRARPVESLVEVGGLSFPSGHAFISTVFFGFVIVVLVRHAPSALPVAVGGTVALGLIGLIGTSRVYLGVHFLTDVVGGYAAGFLWLVLTLGLVRLVELQFRGRGSDPRKRAPRSGSEVERKAS